MYIQISNKNAIENEFFLFENFLALIIVSS